MSMNGGYQAQPDEMRAAAGSITAEVLRVYNLLQHMQSRPIPSFGPVGGVAKDATRDLRDQLAKALETTLERMNTVNLLIAQAAETYSLADREAAADFGFREVR